MIPTVAIRAINIRMSGVESKVDRRLKTTRADGFVDNLITTTTLSLFVPSSRSISLIHHNLNLVPRILIYATISFTVVVDETDSHDKTGFKRRYSFYYNTGKTSNQRLFRVE